MGIVLFGTVYAAAWLAHCGNRWEWAITAEIGVIAFAIAAYGAGIQVHIEDLAAHIAGRERCDAEARWQELQPAYEALASKLG